MGASCSDCCQPEYSRYEYQYSPEQAQQHFYQAAPAQNIRGSLIDSIANLRDSVSPKEHFVHPGAYNSQGTNIAMPVQHQTYRMQMY